MGARRRYLRAAAPLAAFLAFPGAAAAQAFTAPRGVGAITFAWQWIDNTGHRLSDGSVSSNGASVTTSLLLDGEYAVTDRLSASVGIPYIFAKYNGPPFIPLSGQPADACLCWNSRFSDFLLSARYRLGGETWAATPVVRVGQPSHAYPYRGEAVVGKGLSEVQIGVSTGLRLVELLPAATVQAGYSYAFVEKAIDEISVNRSNVFVDVGYAATRRLYVRGGWLWQHTHGGLLLREVITSGRGGADAQIRKVRQMQLVGGLSFVAGPVDLYSSFTKYVWGRDSHNGWALSTGASFYFGQD